MSVRRRQSGSQAEIWLPTDVNRDLGLFLMFLGVVGVVPLQYFLAQSLPVEAGASAGLLVAVCGFMLVRFSRKRFLVSNNEVLLREGLFKRPLRYRWESQPAIRLRSQEEERGGKVREYWLVYLVDGKRQYALDHRAGNQIESRSLAEALAKAINCPVMEKTDSGEISIPREELDVPFRDRVKSHPTLLGPEVDKPENCQVEFLESETEQRYSWRLMNPGLLAEIGWVVLGLLLLAMIPLFPGYEPADDGTPQRQGMQLSFVDLALKEHNYTYFYVIGAVTVVTLFVAFGYSKRLTVNHDEVRLTDRLYGGVVIRRIIKANVLEEIWVRNSSRGAHLQFISDEVVISGRTSSLQVASWIASRVRRFYAI